jgi:hypothetical protein
MSLFSRTREELLQERAERGAYQETLEERSTRLLNLLEVFEKFVGWETFRMEYLEKTRLRQLERASIQALQEPENIRLRLSGQSDEVLFLLQSKEEVMKKLKQIQLERATETKRLIELNRKIERMPNG